jgi:translation initiation factor eIF-2B subunit epsilon
MRSLMLCLLTTCFQKHCASSDRLPLFGQILAALYQDDIVEEDDIRKWHTLPKSKGIDLKPGTTTENIKKCWLVGTRMIEQFDEQDSDEEDSE